MSEASITSPVPLTTQGNDPGHPNVWDELLWRGLIHVSTDRDELSALLGGEPITVYCGFDPTAPSLHLGNLVQILLLRRLQLAGHRPLALVGGATGLIGDPRPTAERVLNDRETVSAWVRRLGDQLLRFLDASGSNGVRLVDNLEWTESLSAIDLLRDIGKHFRVGTMLKKDAVAARLNSDAGISYTEFSYQILQGHDFLELYRRHGCVLQTGGSDQWGNLTSGTDLVHRVERASVHAIGTPLITNSDGTKFGKSEGNAVWLDPEMTSPYAFYQFWLRTDDADVIDRLKIFTFRTGDEIAELEAAVRDEPSRRRAQLTLAADVTTLVHGRDAWEAVSTASEALFGRGELSAVDAEVLETALRELPHVDVGRGSTVEDALTATGLSRSLGEARRAIAQGGVTVNGVRVLDGGDPVDTALIDGRMAVLRRGKKTMAGVFVKGDTPEV